MQTASQRLKRKSAVKIIYTSNVFNDEISQNSPTIMAVTQNHGIGHKQTHTAKNHGIHGDLESVTF